MRILMVHDESLDGGYGAERYVARLVDGLRAAGDDVDVLAGEVRHGGLRRVLDVWDPAARRLVAHHAQRFAPDVVHLHNIARELSASVVGAVPGVPAVMTVHDLRLVGAREHRVASGRGLAERTVTSILRRIARRRLAATIGVSDHVSQRLRQAGFPAVSTVPVPAGRVVVEAAPVSECTGIAVVARLAPDKGVDVVIDALAQLDDIAPSLVIAGDGPQRAELERRAARLGGRVEFLGHCDDAGVSRLLASSRVVVVASVPGRRPEGSSLALVEAAAHGRPVIASDDPAVREVADRLGNTILVPPADAGALADALRRLLNEDDLASRLGQHGRQAAGRHSVEAVTAATRDVYREVLGPANQ